MKNQLKQVENNLRYIAKRNKNITYSIGLALIYLMLGINAFSEDVIATTNKQEIVMTAEKLGENLRNIKRENEKRLKGSQLELIQLMEQGNQVVKSPWASWQFGINFMYNNWSGSYKGRGDKKEKYPYEGIFTRSDDIFERSVSPLSEKYEELTSSTNPYSASTNARKELASGYGLVSTISRQEPLVAINVDASIRLKDVQRDPIPAPTVAVQAPNFNPISPNSLLPPPVDIPESATISSPAKTPSIDVNPVTDYQFYHRGNAGKRWTELKEIDGLGYTYWSGYNPDTGKSEDASRYWYDATTKKLQEVDQTSEEDLNNGHPLEPLTYSTRVTNVFYLNHQFDDNTKPLGERGFIFDGKDANVWVQGRENPVPSYYPKGTIAMHTVWDGKISNITGHLMGNANFISTETWHSGKLTLDNVNVNIKGDDNSVFYVYPSGYETLTSKWYHAYRQRGGFNGSLNVDIQTKRNFVYVVMGTTGSYKIKSTGNYNLAGPDNMVYLGLGYAPNFQNFLNKEEDSGNVIDHDNTGLTPSIQLTTPVKSTGDDNIILMFDSTWTGPRPASFINNNQDEWIKSIVGIYQGEIDVRANIGTEAQTSVGNKTEKDENYVEGNIGVYSRSGQREGIKPTEDLGAKKTNLGFGPSHPSPQPSVNMPNYDLDLIHNLEVGAAQVYFGKYAKDGIMFAAEKGSVIDVAKNDKRNNNLSGFTANTEITASTEIRDSNEQLISSADDNVNQAATGTVIAYANGTWDKDVHLKMSNDTKNALHGKASQINIYKPVIISARAKVNSLPVAYIADNGGIINVEKNTIANGFSTVVALVQNSGNVNVKGDIIAKDAWAATDTATKPFLFTNVGAYAGENGKVIVEGNVDIHGTAAMASGANSIVELKGTGNQVQTGKNGALTATNGGEVHFGGGKIIHKENEAGDHASTTPFYADNTSNINFTGATTIEIADGILMPGTTAGDYTATAGTASKYNGMENVKIKLIGDNVVLKSTSGEDTVWTGASGVVTDIKIQMKLNDFDLNGKKYKIYYINGTFKIDTDMNLSDSSIAFHNVGLSREKVTINSGKTVSSTTGKGLAIASNNGATNNMQSGYTNKGKVSITGGTSDSIALNVSYGHVINENIINIDNGIGAYGINGSKLVNNGNINVTTQGIGMLAFASPKTLADFDKTKGYGTDKKIDNNSLTAADKVLEIENNNTITVNGNKSIGLYGETNDVKNTGLVKAINGHIVNNGKLILTGDESYGIVSKGAGNIIKLHGTGSSDIITGKSGIGVYAEGESAIDFTSPSYGFEIKEKGTGIFVKNGSIIANPGNIELKYTGSNTGTGVALFYEGGTIIPNMTNNLKVNLVDTVGTTGGLVGLYTKGVGTLSNNADINGESGYGIITEGTVVENNNLIEFNSPITNKKASVGIYTKLSDKIINYATGKILLGNDSVGIYGHEVENFGEITVGDSGTGIYSTGGLVNLRAGSKINVAKAKAAAVYTKGNGQIITADVGSNLSIGDTSFGFINEGTGNTIHSNIANQSLGNDTVYIYSKDLTGYIFNNTNLKSMTGLPNYGAHPGGSLNYGIYSAGTVENNANIDFSSGEGNVGIYSIDGGTATNKAGKIITVGKSYIHETDVDKNRYSLAMAAGFTPDSSDVRTPYIGEITNEGILKVNGEYSIGMYGTETGTVVKNAAGARIELNASNTTGMYLDNGALGINDGTIETNSSGLEKVVGVVVKNGAKIQNNGTIKIHADSSVGILSKGNAAGANPGIIENYGTFSIVGNDSKEIQTPEGTEPLEKSLGGISIKTPKNSSIATIEVDGKVVTPEKIDTKGLKEEKMLLSSIGMYINTSGIKFTNPIIGLNALKNLKKADLIIGTEATESTNSKYIQIGKKILDPYNKTIKDNPQIEKWSIYSSSLTWMANIAQNQSDGTIENAYLAKIPYTEWAGKMATPVDSKDTYNFTNGLEQRYGVEAIGTRENQLFQKLNGIGKNEEILLFQAFDEMMGHQYANVQQRIHSTGQILDKEFDYLKDEWRTASKDSNKVKVFGMKGEYSTDTAGVIDYKNNAYGVAYVGENETVKLGNTTGWYTGLVHNTFKFKDIGNSKEEMLQAKLGVFNSKAFDDNNSLNWTISGEAFVGYNKMHRKFLVVDEIFNARSRYWSYGVALKNELSKTFRLSEDFSLRGYGSIKAEYGRFQKIKEKSGEVRLEIKANDYISIKPEIGGELIYKTPLSGRNFFNAKLGVAYENELGRVGDAKNKARVAHTTADWFNIRGEKEDRRGNVKTDLSLGWDNEAYGITANIGYDTKGKNRRAGLGLRVIF